MTALRAAAGWLLWHLREVAGEHGCHRYVEYHGRRHSDGPVASRREFERRRMDGLDRNQRNRCC